MYGLVLACGSEEQATIRCKGESSEKRGKRLVSIDRCISDSKVAHSTDRTEAADAG
jgi:hypothetical protein